MVFISLPEMTRWGNFYFRLSSVLGPSPSHGGGLRAPFLFGRGVTGMAAPTMPRAWTSSVFQSPARYDVSVQPRFLVRSQILTRM
jgi:hypothetical protein